MSAPAPSDAVSGMVALDPSDPNLVQGDLGGFELLRPFNQAGVLAAADVHTAIRLVRMAGSSDEQLALAAALAVRAPRVGHVSVDLADARISVVDADEEVDLDLLPWPDPEAWLSQVADSDLVAKAPGADGEARPLVLAGRALYLDRYWRDETTVASEILSRLGPALSAESAAEDIEGRLERLFPGAGSSDQLRAARLARSGRFTVIAGGPGTGKTTTVARLLALLLEEAEAAGRRPPLVGLAAPTGKAAARMEEAVRAEAGRLETSPGVRAALAEISGSTLHRLLGTRFDRPGRFRHHRGHRLPHDVVVVDEASMVSLSLMASLVEAVRPDARLVLVGDPEQLVSVEAGAVLADIVGPAGTGGPAAPPAPAPVPGRQPGGGGVAASIAVLRQNHRFAGTLARLSEAVRAGRSEEVLAILASGDPAVSWVDADPGTLVSEAEGVAGPPAGSGPLTGPLIDLRAATAAWAAEVRAAAASGDAAGAIDALRRHRFLCAHRRGPAGVARWNRLIEQWVIESPASSLGDGTWYPGRPVLVTANDYALKLYNGDTGVVVHGGDGSSSGRLVVAFDEGHGRPARTVSPSRLNAVETVFAMTVHKSQGSEFDRVTLLLPPATSRLLTRELLYTAITRARQGVSVMGTAEALRLAVERPIARASGLGGRLWGSGPPAH